MDRPRATRAENDEGCWDGPANGGVVDGNTVEIAVRNDTSQAGPGDVGDTLRIDPVNGAHARLSWGAAGGGGAAYRVYRAAFPDAVTDLHATETGTRHEDVDVLVDGTT